MRHMEVTTIKQRAAALVFATFLNSPAMAYIPAAAPLAEPAVLAELQAGSWGGAYEMPYLNESGTTISTAESVAVRGSAGVGAAPEWQRSADRQLRRDTRNRLGMFVYFTEIEVRGAYLDAQRAELADMLDLRPEQFNEVEKLSPLVQQMAARFELQPQLLMAMIHTESTFNAAATSHANAYGLMQIVPKYAGRAARGLLTGKRERPAPEELLHAETNVELGSAYLTILQDRYFAHIEDAEVRNLAVIAAYNWGPGRVRKVISHHGSEPTVQEFVELMVRKAPRETSDYVQRVARRAHVYTDWFAHVDKNDFESPILAQIYDLSDAVEGADPLDQAPAIIEPSPIEESVEQEVVLAMN